MGKFGQNPLAGIVHDGIVIELLTLAANSVLTGNSTIDSVRAEGFRVLKTEYWIGINGKADGEGPITCGMSVGLSAAEIAEAILANPQKRGDRAEHEQSSRPVWPLISFGVNNAQQINDGMWRSKNIGWSIQETEGLQFYAFNSDNSALTTGTKIFIEAKHFGVWLKD